MRKNAKTHAARPRASTGDVLGLVVLEPPTVPRKWAEHHNALKELKQRLMGERVSRTESAKSEIPNFSEHMADAATDTYDRDWALAALSSAQNALYEIEQAINRIFEGTYGVCEITGKDIEAARLKAIPWTRFSAEAQMQLEARGQGAKFQLGKLGSYFSNPDAAESDSDSDETTELREAA